MFFYDIFKFFLCYLSMATSLMSYIRPEEVRLRTFSRTPAHYAHLFSSDSKKIQIPSENGFGATRAIVQKGAGKRRRRTRARPQKMVGVTRKRRRRATSKKSNRKRKRKNIGKKKRRSKKANYTLF